MIIELSIASVCLAAIVLVVFLVLTLIQTKKTLKATRRELIRMSEEALRLMRSVEELTEDLQSKSESLDFAFRPLKKLNRELGHKGRSCNEEEDTVEQVMDWISTSCVLYNKLKSVIKGYGK